MATLWGKAPFFSMAPFWGKTFFFHMATLVAIRSPLATRTFWPSGARFTGWPLLARRPGKCLRRQIGFDFRHASTLRFGRQLFTLRPTLLLAFRNGGVRSRRWRGGRFGYRLRRRRHFQPQRTGDSRPIAGRLRRRHRGLRLGCSFRLFRPQHRRGLFGRGGGRFGSHRLRGLGLLFRDRNAQRF
jgi:hypothetical protein